MSPRYFFTLGVLLSLFCPAVSQEKVKLMYLETDHEVRLAVLIHRLKLPLPVHRIGVFRVGQKLYGVVRFGAADSGGSPASQHQIGTTTAMLCDRMFGELPDLARIDFEGVSFVETKERKPEVFYSSSVDRVSWRNIPKTLTPLQRVEMTGALYFDPCLPLGEPLKTEKPKSVKKPPQPNKTREKSGKSESP